MNNELIKRINCALYDDADPYQALRDCRAELERRKYVPMTDDELGTAAGYPKASPSFVADLRAIEQAVIKRAGLEPVHKPVQQSEGGDD